MTASPRAPAAAIELDRITVAYDDAPVLDDISLAIRPGEFFALLGPSGSGKSTLLRLIAGFVTARSGRLRVGGEDIAAVPPWRRDIGIVFQNYALWPHMSVARNIAFGLEERRWPRARIGERVREMLDLVSLAGLGDRRPSELSGGQQQRVAIARTLAIEPRVLLLDEPLSNLDARLRASTAIELRRLQRRLGVTTVFVTHDQQEAMTVADRLAVLERGRVGQVGTPRELYDTPASRFVAEFVGSLNVLPARLVGRDGGQCVIDVPGFAVLRLPAARVEQETRGATEALAIGFRPHAVSPLAGDRPAGLDFEATIDAVEFVGEFVRYRLSAGEARIVADVPHARFAPALASGSRARFHVAADEIIALPA